MTPLLLAKYPSFADQSVSLPETPGVLQEVVSLSLCTMEDLLESCSSCKCRKALFFRPIVDHRSQYRSFRLLLDGRLLHRRARKCYPLFIRCLPLGHSNSGTKVFKIRWFPRRLVELLRLGLRSRFDVLHCRQRDLGHVGSLPSRLRRRALERLHRLYHCLLVMLWRRTVRQQSPANGQQYRSVPDTWWLLHQHPRLCHHA